MEIIKNPFLVLKNRFKIVKNPLLMLKNRLEIVKNLLLMLKNQQKSLENHFEIISISEYIYKNSNERFRMTQSKAFRRHQRRTSSQQTYLSQSNTLMRKQENRLTRISIGIVSLYIICHIWRILPTAYEALYSEDGTVLSRWPQWLIHVYHLSHTLIVTNSAINFLLYIVL